MKQEKRNKRIYTEWLKVGWRVRGWQSEKAKELGVIRQRINQIIQEEENRIRKKIAKAIKDILVKEKFSKVKTSNEKEEKALAEAMILNGFSYSEIERYGIMDRRKASELVDIAPGNPDNLEPLTEKLM